MIPTIEQIIIAIGIVIVSMALSTIINYLIQKSKTLTSRTKTTLDDAIVKIIARPVHLLFRVGGIVLAVWYLYPALTYRGYDYGDLTFVLISLLVAYTVNRLIRGIIGWYEDELANGDKGNGQGGVFGFLETLISILVWGFAILFILNHFGVEVTTLFAGLGIVGLAVAFGLQNTLAGIFSAVFLAIDKPVRSGDFVKLSDGNEGFVEDIGLRSTRIRTFSNNYIIVPNTQLSEMVITNCYQPDQEIGILVPCGVSYGTDLEKAEKIAIEVAKKVLKNYEGIEDFEPVVRYNEFADSAINFNVILRVKYFVDQYIVKHEYIKELYKAYEKAKIEIPYPKLDVHLHK